MTTIASNLTFFCSRKGCDRVATVWVYTRQNATKSMCDICAKRSKRKKVPLTGWVMCQ